MKTHPRRKNSNISILLRKFCYITWSNLTNSVLIMQTTTQTPAPVIDNRNGWRWGFTPQAEIWNGRLAMLGFSIAALIELFSGQGFLSFGSIM